MKKLLATAAIILMSTTASFAASFNFPADEPVASVEVPDSWQPSTTDYGVEGSSSDGGTYVSVDIAGASDVETIMTDIFAFLEEHGVVPDPATQKENKDSINGMPFQTIDWSGTDKDGPVSIGVGIITLSDEKIAIVTYWASKESEQANMPDVGKILGSIKPL